LSDGGNVSGADTATLTITNVQSPDEGIYRCEVIDGCLVAISRPALLAIVVPASVAILSTSSRSKCTNAS